MVDLSGYIKKRAFQHSHLLLMVGFMVSFLGLPNKLSAQNDSYVKATIDTASIRIGEQISYTVSVDTDTLNLVAFPEDQTFSPLEMVEALKIDTVKKKDRMTLERIYLLTQFDSGSYTIPQQRIDINQSPIMTDSFRIRVGDVPVDTTKQKMFDIKPLIEVDRSYAGLGKTLLIGLLVLAIAALAIWWFFFRKKPLTEEEKVALLPPFDRAIKQLKELENSRLLLEDNHKQYYSRLTNIVRSYIEEETDISALESTTDQLIERITLMKDAGRLSLGNETIDNFRKVLQTADLVKFAKSKPDNTVAEADRQAIERIVVKTKEALPEPTEEDLMLTKAYQEEQERLRKKKQMYRIAAAIAFLIALGIGTTVSYYGFTNVKDTVLREPSKRLLEDEWVKSDYGFPTIIIETPGVMIRREVTKEELIKDSLLSAQAFGLTNKDAFFSVSVRSLTYANEKQVPLDLAANSILTELEVKGAKNMIAKNEEAFTQTGKQGLKTYGSFSIQEPDSNNRNKARYSILTFGGSGFTQQIVITWEDGNDYAEKIVQRILASVDFKVET